MCSTGIMENRVFVPKKFLNNCHMAILLLDILEIHVIYPPKVSILKFDFQSGNVWGRWETSGVESSQVMRVCTHEGLKHCLEDFLIHSHVTAFSKKSKSCLTELMAFLSAICFSPPCAGRPFPEVKTLEPRIAGLSVSRITS